MSNQKIAEFIFGILDMSVTSELPKDEQLDMIKADLENIKGTSLYYYLQSACEINAGQCEEGSIKKLRYVTLSTGTGMGDELIIFETNAPIDMLKELEKESCEIYIKGGDSEDVPIWGEVLNKRGYTFEYVDSCRHVTPYGSSRSWLETHELASEIKEQYVIDNQPELTK